MRRLEIPSTVPLFGLTYRVEWADAILQEGGEEAHAKVDMDRRVLTLARPAPGEPATVIEESYLHELLHILCFHLCEDDLNVDEHRIERLALGLHQMLTQATYSDSIPPVHQWEPNRG